MITLIRILMIWALAWLLIVVSRNAIRLLENRLLVGMRRPSDLGRVDALRGVLQYSASFLIISVAILLTLDESGFSITPLLLAAGVAGLALALGAQHLVKDFTSGVLMLAAGQVSEGDWVEVAGKRGCVQTITLRHLQLRDDAGNVHFIPNRFVAAITNQSHDDVHAEIELSVRADTNLHDLIDCMQAAARHLRRDPETGAHVTGDLIVDGVEYLDANAMGLRCRLPVVAGHQQQLRRLFLGRMKQVMENSNNGNEGQE